MKNYILLIAVILIAGQLFGLNAPTLYSPADNSTYIKTSQTLTCRDVNDDLTLSNYTFQLDTVPTFDSPMLETSSATSSHSYGYLYKSNPNLRYGQTYYWRVKYTDGTTESAWSATWSFSTVSAITPDYPTNNLTGLYTSRSIVCDIEESNRDPENYDFEMDTVPTFDSPAYTSTHGSYFDGSWIYRTNSNLLYGQTYYWRARVRNAADTSEWSATWNFTTQTAITPDYPTNNLTGLYTSRSIVCDIEESNRDPENYDFEMDTVPTFDSPVYTSTHGSYFDGSWIYRTNPNMLYGQTYYWRARVRNAADTSEWSATWNFTTLNTITLDYPYNNSTNVSIDQFIACDEETSNTNSDNYEFEMDTVPTFDSPLLEHSVGSYHSGSWIYKNNSDMRYGQTYYWRARVKNDNDVSDWTTVWNFKTAYELTEVPALITPENNAGNIDYDSFLIDWDAITGATSYQYQISETSDFESLIKNGNTSLTDRTITNLQANTIYYWRVRGENANGYSDWSNVWKFTTDQAVMTAPTLISPSDNSTNISYASVDFDWQDVFGANQYIFEISQDNTFTTGVTSLNPENSAQNLSGLNPETTYYWHVASTDGYTTSDWSNTWAFSTENTVNIQNANKNQIQIYPNPTSDFININYKSNNLNYDIFDMQGKLMKSGSVDNQIVSLGNVKDGTYFIRFTEHQKLVASQIIVKQ